MLHYVAAVVAVGLTGVALCRQCPWTMSAVPFAAYLFAWLGHVMIERNHPATWRYPWWSLRAEGRMVRLALTGRLAAELRAHRLD